MAEEIRPNTEVSRGFISTSRPGRSLLDGLASALDTVSGTIEDTIKGVAQKEFEETNELLSNPLITQEEVNEIEAEANFPISRIKAENRRGSLRAENSRADLENALNGAVDAVDTRRILREHQQQLLEDASSRGEQAGIREYFADTAPRFLAEASKRRQEQALSDERETTNSVLLGASRKDPSHFFTVAKGIVLEESIDNNGDVTENHSDIVAGALGRYAENDASAPDMIEFLQNMLAEDGLVRLRDRALYTKAIKVIETDAQAGDTVLTYAQRKAAALSAVQQEAMAEIRENPRGTLSDATIARVREYYDDPLEAEKWLLAAQQFEGKPSVIGSKAYDEALAALKEKMGSSFQVAESNEVGVFRNLAAALAPHILDDEDQGRSVLLALVDEATSLVDAEDSLKEQVEANTKAQRDEILKLARKAERLDKPELAKRLRGNATFLENNAVLKRDQVQQGLYRQAEIRGFDIRDDLINLLE